MRIFFLIENIKKRNFDKICNRITEEIKLCKCICSIPKFSNKNESDNTGYIDLIECEIMNSRLDLENAFQLLFWGIIKFDSNFYEEAQEYLSRSIILNPDLELAYFYRSKIPSTVNIDFIADAKKALSFNSSEFNYQNLINLLINAGDYSEATFFVNIALQLNANSTCLLYQKAIIQKNTNNFCDAVLILKNILELRNCNSSNCKYLLWQYYDSVNEDQKALYFINLINKNDDDLDFGESDHYQYNATYLNAASISYYKVGDLQESYYLSSKYGKFFSDAAKIFFKEKYQAYLLRIINERRDKSDYFYLHLLGNYHYEFKDYENALCNYNLYFDLYPTDLVNLEKIENTKERICQEIESTINEFYSNKQYDKCIEQFENFENRNLKIKHKLSVGTPKKKHFIYCDSILRKKLGSEYDEAIDVRFRTLLKILDLNTDGKISFKNLKMLDCYKLARDYFFIYCKQYRLKFGVHKGISIEEMIEKNPDYILWCVINLSSFILDYKILADHRMQKVYNYKEALMVNYCKFHLRSFIKQTIIDDEIDWNLD